MTDDLMTFDRASFEETVPALMILGRCVEDVAAAGVGAPVFAGDLLRDDDVYFWAADALTEPAYEQGWRALAQRLDGLPSYRAAVLAHGCGGDFRNGTEVIFLGEMAMDDAA